MADDIKQTVTIDANFAKLFQELQKTKTEFSSTFSQIQSAANSALGTLGVGLGAAAFVGFSKQVVDLGDKLSDLSDQTGISIEVLGGIRTIAEQSGSSLDSFAKGINRAQKEIGGLDDSGKKLLQSLGTSQQELVNSSPDEFLEKLARALGTVENQYERNAIGAKLLGKSYAELAPTINEVAEHGLPRLAQETAEAYRNLGALKDQSDALKAKLYDLGATALVTAGHLSGLIPLSEIQAVGQAAQKVDFLTGKFARLKGVSAGAIDAQTIDQLKALEKSIPDQGVIGQLINPSGKKTLQELIAARQEQEKLLAVANNVKKATAGQGDFKGLLTGAGGDVNKAKSELDSFFSGIDKQIQATDLEFAKLSFGDEQLTLALQLEDQFLDLQKQLADQGKTLSAADKKRFQDLVDALTTSKTKVEELKAAFENMSPTIQAFADAANEGVGIVATAQTPQQAAAQKSAADQFRDLRTQLKIDLLPEGSDEKRIAQIQADYERTFQRIQELAREAGLSNAESAQLTADAWERAASQIDDITNKTKQQFREAAEGIGQAFGDALAQIGQGNFKDVGKNLERQIGRAITDAFLTKPLQEGFKKISNDLFGNIFGGAKGVPGVPLPGGPEVLGNQQFQLSTTQFSTAVAQFSAAVAAQNATAPAAIAGTANPANLGSSLGGGSSAFNSFNPGPLVGGLLANWLGKGGGAAIGYGSAPAGVEGPLMANGGFFSSAFGGISNWFSNLFHNGGPIGKLHGGGPSDFAALDLSGAHGEAAARVMKQLASLKPDERVIIGQAGEFVINKEAARFAGADLLEGLNNLRSPMKRHDGGAIDLPSIRGLSLPRLEAPSLDYMKKTSIPNSAIETNRRGGGSQGEHHHRWEFHVHGVTDADSFRRNQATILRDIARTVQAGFKEL